MLLFYIIHSHNRVLVAVKSSKYSLPVGGCTDTCTCQFMFNPSTVHWIVVQHILRCLEGAVKKQRTVARRGAEFERESLGAIPIFNLSGFRLYSLNWVSLSSMRPPILSAAAMFLPSIWHRILFSMHESSTFHFVYERVPPDNFVLNLLVPMASWLISSLRDSFPPALLVWAPSVECAITHFLFIRFLTERGE